MYRKDTLLMTSTLNLCEVKHILFAIASATFPRVIMLGRTLTRTAGRAARFVRSKSTMPAVKPANPPFSSGPCTKRPGYTIAALSDAALGRSHRAKVGKAKLGGAIQGTRDLLEPMGLPKDYHIGIVAGSDTGAVEMAMWGLLGPKPVTVVHFENFGGDWYTDAAKQLKLKDLIELKADYGKLPDLKSIDFSTDVVFTYNGTTSGVRVPPSFVPPANREGLVICDATSAVFAMDMPWANLDVITFSWQKCLGGEGAHGMLILSPRAVARLESYTPPWPMPKLFRMTKKGKLDVEIFSGATINTPSLLATEDYLDALKWAKSIGGYKGLVDKANANLAVLEKFVAENDWIEFLSGDDKSVRSNTSVCLKVKDLDADGVKKMAALLEKQNVALDVGAYRSAPPGFRIWCGPTVEAADLQKLLPWMTWAHDEAKAA